MQKMLVILVLVLIGAVAILSFSVYSLRDDLGSLRLSQSRSHFRSQPRDTDAAPVPVSSGVDQRELTGTGAAAIVAAASGREV